MEFTEYLQLIGQLRNCDLSLIKMIHQQPIQQQFESKDIPLSSYQALISNRWLNDEIMYGYSKLLQQKAYCMNSHFYELLQRKKHDNAVKWIKQIKNPVNNTLLCFPVNINNVHWVAVGVDFEACCVIYNDSMGGISQDIIGNLLLFLQEKQQQLQEIVKCQYDVKLFQVFSRDQVTNLNKNQNLYQIEQFFSYKVQFIDFNIAYAQKFKLQVVQEYFMQNQQQQMVEQNQLQYNQQLRYYYFAANMPKQDNCDDCGVYSIMFLKFFCKVCSDCANGSIKNEMRYMIANELVRQELQYWDV